MFRRLMCATVCALLVSLASAPVADARTGSVAAAAAGSSSGGPPPVVTGPITSGAGNVVIFSHTNFDLATVGYQQREFFVAGTAHAYTPLKALTSDGRWKVAPTSPAAYKTRIVVDRPIDPQRFNGTVVVEWLNVSGQVDASPDWTHMHDELIRDGFAWVGVSAQAVGMNALKGAFPFGDPVRYASLTHPGDSYSYDMFSQSGRVVRNNAAQVLGGLHPRTVLAVGESQSAGRMVSYIDAVAPLARAYDGFPVHSRGASGAPLSQTPLTAVAAPSPTLIRTDLRVPVLTFNTETDTSALHARQPDSRHYRLWEVAGTAHFDDYGLILGATDRGDLASAAAWFDSMRNPTNQPNPLFTCASPINSGPQTFVLRAGIAWLNRWVTLGTPPPIAPRLDATSISPPVYALDANGNARGGIRTPAVDAPVAKLSGLGQTGSQFCSLFGTTVPFSTAQLTTLYGNQLGFAAAWIGASLRAALSQFVLPADAFSLAVVGAASNVLP